MVCAEVRAGGRTSSLSENMNDKGYDLETYSQSSSLLLLVNLLVQLRPGDLDLLQLAEALCTEVVNGALVAGFGRVRSELAVQEPPREGFGSAKGESPVDQPSCSYYL